MKRLKTVLQNIRDNLILFYICSKLRIIHACHKQAIVFISTPTHGNLGDQAIVYSQYRFFESMRLSKRIVEIHRYCYERWKEKFSKIIDRTDVITTVRERRDRNRHEQLYYHDVPGLSCGHGTVYDI